MSALGFQALHGVDLEGKPLRATRRSITRTLEAVRAERYRQVAKWGDDSAKDHPDGICQLGDNVRELQAKFRTDSAAAAGQVTWRLILEEEVAEAFNAHTDADLRAELVQVAAVAVKWIEAIDRRINR